MGEVGFLVARLQLGLSAEHPSTGLQGLLMHLLMSCLDFASFGCCCWVVFFLLLLFICFACCLFPFSPSPSPPLFYVSACVIRFNTWWACSFFPTVKCACTGSLVSMSASYSSCEGTSSFQFMSLRVLKLFSHRLDLFFFIGGVYCLFVTSQVIE